MHVFMFSKIWTILLTGCSNKWKSIQAKLYAALQSSENKSKISSDSTGGSTESATITKKLEEDSKSVMPLLRYATFKVLGTQKHITDYRETSLLMCD